MPAQQLPRPCEETVCLRLNLQMLSVAVLGSSQILQHFKELNTATLSVLQVETEACCFLMRRGYLLFDVNLRTLVQTASDLASCTLPTHCQHLVTCCVHGRSVKVV